MNNILRSLLILFILYHVCVEAIGNSNEEDTNGSKNSRAKRQRSLIKRWFEKLSETTDEKSIAAVRGPQELIFLRFFADLLKLAQGEQAHVFMVLVGACDGQNDDMIQLYLGSNKNTVHGLFVEANPLNVPDLNSFLSRSHESSRSHVINAAASSNCPESGVITFDRPNFEGNQSKPHWVRREIGTIQLRKNDVLKDGWVRESVTCMDAPALMRNWKKQALSDIK